MPYMIVPRSGNFYVHKRGADGRPEGRSLGKHGSRGKAERQRDALYAHEKSQRKTTERYRSVSLVPVTAMSIAAQQGLDCDDKSMKDYDRYASVASDLATQQRITPRTVRWLHKAFGKLAGADGGSPAGSQKEPTPEWVAWQMCGGDVGRRWVAQRVKEIEAMKALNTSNAGSLGFAVGGGARPGTTRYTVDDEVEVLSAGESGVVMAAWRSTKGVTLYRVALKADRGLVVCTSMDLHPATRKGIKGGKGLESAVLAKYLKLTGDDEVEDPATKDEREERRIQQEMYRLSNTLEKFVKDSIRDFPHVSPSDILKAQAFIRRSLGQIDTNPQYRKNAGIAMVLLDKIYRVIQGVGKRPDQLLLKRGQIVDWLNRVPKYLVPIPARFPGMAKSVNALVTAIKSYQEADCLGDPNVVGDICDLVAGVREQVTTPEQATYMKSLDDRVYSNGDDVALWAQGVLQAADAFAAVVGEKSDAETSDDVV